MVPAGWARIRSGRRLNGFCQMHEVKNVFVVDGAAFTTASEKNPTLTILAGLACNRLHGRRDSRRQYLQAWGTLQRVSPVMF